jgi:hypothetical protein
MFRLPKKLRSAPYRPKQRGKTLRFEQVEDRRVMSAASLGSPLPVRTGGSVNVATSSNWIDTKLTDAGIRSQVEIDYQDGSISRADMLGLYTEIETDGKVTKAERKDLITICNTATGVEMPDDVHALASDVAGSSPANRRYQGKALGNLKNGDSAGKLVRLVDKWFYGDDLPAIDPHSRYIQANGDLFVDGPSYSDVQQGDVGDCYLLSSLAEVAEKYPTVIENMFTDNGDGTFAVRFFENGVARYVTVNRELPINSRFGFAEYANFVIAPHQEELWVALAEKAYCQMNEAGWIGQNGANSYKGINSGSPVDAIAQITGNSAGFTTITSNSSSSMLSTIVHAFENNQAVTLATKNKGTAANVVSGHSYAMLDYNASTQQITLYNPWGLDNGSAFPGLITLSWSQIVHSFSEWEAGSI